MFGLYYVGLKDQAFYWQVIVVDVRKVCLIAGSIAFAQSEPSV